MCSSEGKGEEGTQGRGCTRGRLRKGGDRGRGRAAAAADKPLKSKKPKEDPEGGGPSAFDSMD